MKGFQLRLAPECLRRGQGGPSGGTAPIFLLRTQCGRRYLRRYLWRLADFPLPEIRRRIADLPLRHQSSAASPAAPACNHLFNFDMVHHLASIGLADASLNLFDVPPLHINVCTNGLVEQVYYSVLSRSAKRQEAQRPVLRAGSLAPLVKTRGFGMTPLWNSGLAGPRLSVT